MDPLTKQSIDLSKMLRWQQNCIQIMNATLEDADREIEQLRGELYSLGMINESGRLLELRKRIVKSTRLALE